MGNKAKAKTNDCDPSLRMEATKEKIISAGVIFFVTVVLLAAYGILVALFFDGERTRRERKQKGYGNSSSVYNLPRGVYTLKLKFANPPEGIVVNKRGMRYFVDLEEWQQKLVQGCIRFRKNPNRKNYAGRVHWLAPSKSPPAERLPANQTMEIRFVYTVF